MIRTVINCAPSDFLRNKDRLRLETHRASRFVGGFTLLEILVAVSILAIVVSLVFGSFSSIFSSADRVNTGSDLIEMGNACIDRITVDLKAIHAKPYPRFRPPDIDDDPDLFRIEGEPVLMGGSTMSKLRFTSLAHLPFNQTGKEGIAELVYYIQENPDGSFTLHRADHLYPYPEFEPSPSDPALCEQVLTFKLTYFDNNGDELDEWSSESSDVDYSTPKAIGVELAIGDEASPFVFNTKITLPTYRDKSKKG